MSTTHFAPPRFLPPRSIPMHRSNSLQYGLDSTGQTPRRFDLNTPTPTQTTNRYQPYGRSPLYPPTWRMLPYDSDKDSSSSVNSSTRESSTRESSIRGSPSGDEASDDLFPHGPVDQLLRINSPTIVPEYEETNNDGNNESNIFSLSHESDDDAEELMEIEDTAELQMNATTTATTSTGKYNDYVHIFDPVGITNNI